MLVFFARKCFVDYKIFWHNTFYPFNFGMELSKLWRAFKGLKSFQSFEELSKVWRAFKALKALQSFKELSKLWWAFKALVSFQSFGDLSKLWRAFWVWIKNLLELGVIVIHKMDFMEIPQISYFSVFWWTRQKNPKPLFKTALKIN
jgi:hypothetical protein